MAFTRKLLKSMGLEDDKIDQIIDEHLTIVNEIKDERDTLRDKVADFDKVKTELDELKAKPDDYKGKYEREHEAFEKFKAEQTEAKAVEAKRAAYRDMLVTAGVDPKRVDAVMRVSDMSKVTVGDDGKLKDADKLVESVKSDWADFIVKTDTRGADVDKPPAGGTDKAEPKNLTEALMQKYDIK